ncbi:MAG: hypothetical protein DWQ07_19355 [Chloroflexi bacterium]|nr:MAG: hypothetical protein DWQ07_19355 [Chloroflexota bacterium]MBL1194240.1 hypothetical protein [Chloroflexota bacterium]NOH11533.1 hypothetical protein [Chloroflexota bacterium]
MTRKRIWLGIVGSVSVGLAVWWLLHGFSSPTNYGQALAGLFALWLALILLRALKDDLFPADASNNLQNRAYWRLPLNILLSISPGLFLLWFGIFAPASPSVTNSGLDVCQFETGWCVSGTRSMIFFGAMALLVGLGMVYLLIKNLRR